MKKYLLILALSLLVGSLVAFFALKNESTPSKMPPTTLNYKFSSAIREELKNGKPAANQFAAWDYSHIGEYQAALVAWDEVPGPSRRLAASDSLALVALQPMNALSYVLARARTEQIIIINEAHHNPRHRVFTASLLPGLAKLGFRYLAVEAITERQDSSLNQRGYPVGETGFYTKEPQFGQLLRTATRNGYRTVAYDYGAKHSEDMNTSIAAREPAQARNIQRILQADPKAKIVVHCGFSHANEGPDGLGGQPAMAARLRELTNINPFTIDQTALTEAGTPAGEQAVYRLAKAPTSAVFLSAQNKPYAQADQAMSVDVNVYHPRTTYRAGRPDWVFTASRKPVAISQAITTEFPCLVLAYAAEEDKTQAVPVDIVELRGPQDKKALALGKGKYTIVATGQAGSSQTWTIEN